MATLENTKIPHPQDIASLKVNSFKSNEALKIANDAIRQVYELQQWELEHPELKGAFEIRITDAHGYANYPEGTIFVGAYNK